MDPGVAAGQDAPRRELAIASQVIIRVRWDGPALGRVPHSERESTGQGNQQYASSYDPALHIS